MSLPDPAIDRSQGIGASEAAIVLGLDKRRTPFDLWLEKTGKRPHFEGNRYTLMGKKLEPVIAELYAEERGVELQTAEAKRHADLPILWSTPDRLVVGSPLGLECKAVLSPSAAREYGDDSFPARHAVQCALGMACFDLPSWDLAALIGVDLRVYRIERDREMEARLLALLAAWWQKHIVDGEAPKIDGSDAAAAYIESRYPKNSGRMLEATTPEARAMLSVMRDSRLVLDAATDRYEHAANMIRDMIADADGIEAPDIGKVTWRKNKDSVSVDWQAMAGHLADTDDQERIDALKASFTKTRPGSRVLRCNFAEPSSSEMTP